MHESLRELEQKEREREVRAIEARRMAAARSAVLRPAMPAIYEVLASMREETIAALQGSFQQGEDLRIMSQNTALLCAIDQLRVRLSAQLVEGSQDARG